MRGVPDRPLTDAEVRELASGERFLQCIPLVELCDGESVVSTDGSEDLGGSYVFCHLYREQDVARIGVNPEPDQQTWEIIDLVGRKGSAIDVPNADHSRVQTFLEEHYSDEEIQSVKHNIDPLELILEGFPDDPIRPRDIEQFIGDGGAMFDDGEVIAMQDGLVITFYASGEFTIANDTIGVGGYHPEEGWTVIHKIPTDTEADKDQVAEEIGEAATEWLADVYEDPVEIIASDTQLIETDT